MVDGAWNALRTAEDSKPGSIACPGPCSSSVSVLRSPARTLRSVRVNPTPNKPRQSFRTTGNYALSLQGLCRRCKAGILIGNFWATAIDQSECRDERGAPWERTAKAMGVFQQVRRGHGGRLGLGSVYGSGYFVARIFFTSQQSVGCRHSGDDSCYWHAAHRRLVTPEEAQRATTISARLADVINARLERPPSASGAKSTERSWRRFSRDLL